MEAPWTAVDVVLCLVGVVAVLAEDAIKAAIDDIAKKRKKNVQQQTN